MGVGDCVASGFVEVVFVAGEAGAAGWEALRGEQDAVRVEVE